MSKPVLYFVIDTLNTGGAEKSTIEIASKLTTVSVEIIQLFPGDELLSECQAKGLKVTQLGLSTKSTLWSVSQVIGKLVKKYKPDLIQAVLLRSEIAVRIACWNLKNISVIGSFVGDTYNKERYSSLPWLAKLKLGFYQQVDNYTARRVNVYISISNFLKNSYSKKLGIPEEKIVVIPRGRNVKFFKPSIKVGGEIKRILNVGRLRSLKGQDDIIKAFALVTKEYPNTVLEIAGEGPFRKQLEALIQEYNLMDKVYLLGREENIAAKLGEADLFVTSSRHEGQGGALVEAMLAGKAIVASDIPVFKEHLQHKKNALLFELGNTMEMADQIKYLLNNATYAESLGNEAMKYALNTFDINQIVQKHEEVYSKLLMND